jgi:tyrosine-protein kinase Etk/Wzc
MTTQLPDLKLNDHYETVDFGQFLGAMRQRLATIAIFIGIAAFIALAHVLFATPQFTAQGVLYLGETQNTSDSSDLSGAVNLSAYATQSDVETQIGLLTTGTLIQRAVLETGLNTTLRSTGAPPLTYWRWRLFWHASTDVFTPGPQDLEVVNATLAGRFRIVTGPDNTYKLYGKGKLFGDGKPLLIGVIGLPEAVGGASITVMRGAAGSAVSDSPTASTPADVPDIKPGVSYDLDVIPPDVMADNVLTRLSVTAGGSPDQPTQLATLQLRWQDPYQAKQFINALMYDYIATQLQWKTEAASVTENFVTGQIAAVARRLAQADAQLAVFQSQTGILDPQQSAMQAAQMTSQLDSQRTAVLLQQRSFQQLHDAIHAARPQGDPYLISANNDPVLSGLSSSLANAQLQLRQLSSEYTSYSQDLSVQQSQVSEIRRSIANLIENDLAQTTQNLADIDTVIASYNKRHKEQPADALKVAALTRTSNQLGQFYSLLTEKAEQAQISKAATIIATRIVTPAHLPHASTSPKAGITVVAGAVAGMFLGIIFIFLRQTLSGRYETEEQIRHMIKLPVYGKVPVQKLLGGSAFFGPDTPNAFSESFRLINRNVSRISNGKNAVATVILIISANKRDGKTTVAANLAKTFADDGKRVVMLDCDFYLSRLQKLNEIAQAPESGGVPVAGGRPELRQWPNENFSIYNASALPKRGRRLDEAAIAKVIGQLKQEFDYVILDSPPLPIISDGLALAGLSDMILSVVSVKNTERRTFEYHTELLAGVDCPHGVIINGAQGANYAETDAYFMGVNLERKQLRGWISSVSEWIKAAGTAHTTRSPAE